MADLVVGTTDLARVLGVSRQLIPHLQKRGMPKEGRGKWKLDKVVPWYLDQVRADMPTEGIDTSPGVVAARTELYHAQRRRQELEAGRMAGELVKLEDAANALKAVAGACAGGLDALPPRVAGRVANMTDPAEIQTLLLEETRHVRSEIADAVRKLKSRA